ncbi:glutathione S-transferase N-terminal domain-containing protein [Rhizobium calliandrae]|uniref:Glutathione S-transferase N-terminal domain-containing protein n=1 Tax=Rhizobium calliandrae TaxID=1312182 RepID=A0ABT7KGG8_9HYPH|nr:glutathione S-transferase N-terminal domain-containing protein [Rhizobium calliandrae]MDL2407713.1 glutathione S-transferase N-terminal domain-containing protein [Rhizobium calliandrae]
MLNLYFAPGSCALASVIALEESGLDYEARRINLASGEQRSPEYLAVNPKGRVPALVTDKGVVTENVAILGYVAQIAPAACLAPLDDPFEFARMQAFNSYLASTVHVNHAHKGRGYRWTDDAAAIEAMKVKVPQTMSESFALIEEKMLEGPWVMGEQYTVADGYLFTLASWLPGDGVDRTQFEKVSAHHARMLERPAVQRAVALAQV